MPILNYTTTINPEKTCGEIQRMLAKAGAQAIMHEYDDDGVLVRLSFKIECHGMALPFMLPANIGKIYTILQNDRRVPRRNKTMEHAARVSWRIIKDWVEAQLAIVEAEQAEMAEVFLPYMQQKTGQTLYHMLRDSDYKMLGGPSNE